MKRNDKDGLLMDNLQYVYENIANGANKNTNKLRHVTDAVGFKGFDDVHAQIQDNYQYTETGEIELDKEKQIKITYHINSKVEEVRDEQTNRLKVTYTYNERAERMTKNHYQYDPVDQKNYLIKKTSYVREVSGAMISIYEEELNQDQLSDPRQEMPIAGIGVYYVTTNQFVYQLTDHLGNVRATIKDTKLNGEAEVLSYADYYPFGMTMAGRHGASSPQYRLAYQGQELDSEVGGSGFYAFELRNYDPRLGKWLSPDPYQQHWSPYLAMGNNPVSNIDPDGGWKFGFDDPPARKSNTSSYPLDLSSSRNSAAAYWLNNDDPIGPWNENVRSPIEEITLGDWIPKPIPPMLLNQSYEGYGNTEPNNFEFINRSRFNNEFEDIKKLEIGKLILDYLEDNDDYHFIISAHDLEESHPLANTIHNIGRVTYDDYSDPTKLPVYYVQDGKVRTQIPLYEKFNNLDINKYKDKIVVLLTINTNTDFYHPERGRKYDPVVDDPKQLWSLQAYRATNIIHELIAHVLMSKPETPYDYIEHANYGEVLSGNAENESFAYYVNIQAEYIFGNNKKNYSKAQYDESVRVTTSLFNTWKEKHQENVKAWKKHQNYTKQRNNQRNITPLVNPIKYRIKQ